MLEFKVRRSLGLPMTVQWTAELGKVALRPRFRGTVKISLVKEPLKGLGFGV